MKTIVLMANIFSFAYAANLSISTIFKHDTFASLQSCKSAVSNNATTIGFENCQNFVFAIELQIGTPPQSFSLQLDTGSNVLWIPANQSINASTIFNCSASSTCVETSQTQSFYYAGGNYVSGNKGYQIVSISNSNISVNNSMYLIERTQNYNFNGNIVGIVAMGYTTIPNFLDLAFEANQIATNQFILQLKKITDTESSLLYYNDLPENITKSTLFSSVKEGASYWELPVIGFSFGSTDYSQYSVDVAVIDSGTSLFYLNPQLKNQIINNHFTQAQNCQYNQQGQGPFCPCSYITSLPSLYFKFPGVQINIPSSAYIQNSSVSGICFVQIQSLETVQDQLLLGDTLFFQYAITFDKNGKRIGFYGDTTEINSSSDNFYKSQIGMLVINFIILLLMLFLLYHLRLTGLSKTATKQILINDSTTINKGNLQGVYKTMQMREA